MREVLNDYLENIHLSRMRMLEEVKDISSTVAARKPTDESWNIQEVIEHLVLAERGGFNLIYVAAEKFREGKPVWEGESKNNGLSIEEIIEKTWQTKEKAPESAMPVGQWSLGVWASHFRNCDHLLKNLTSVLDGLPLEKVIYPHFLCGPLDVKQRLEFIRFHIDRHHHQILNLKKELN